MDTTLIQDTTTAPAAGARRRSLMIGGAATALSVAGVLWAVLKNGNADASQTSSLPYVAAVAFIVGCALFAWLVPARIAARGTGLPFAIVSIPLVYAFWSALPILVAVAAVLVGTAHRASGGPKRGRALAAVIVACPVILLTAAGILLG